MSKTLAYNIYEAKTKLSQLVKSAQDGDSVVLKVRGKPVAKIVAYEPAGRPRLLGFTPKLKLKKGFKDIPEGFEDYA